MCFPSRLNLGVSLSTYPTAETSRLEHDKTCHKFQSSTVERCIAIAYGSQVTQTLSPLGFPLSCFFLV